MQEDVGSIGLDDDLGVPAALRVRYRVSFDLNAVPGEYRARISDVVSRIVLVDTSGSFAGWGLGNGAYDTVAFCDGEGGSTVTRGNLAWVDDVNVNFNVSAVPEPAPWALTTMGWLALMAMRRRSH